MKPATALVPAEPPRRGRTPRALLAGALLAFAAQAHAFALADTYRMTGQQRAWYFAGVYDHALVAPGMSACLARVPFDRFMKVLARFVSGLPADPEDPLRRKFDAMPAAAVAQMIIEAECAGPRQAPAPAPR